MDISRMYFPTVGKTYFYLNFLLGGGGVWTPLNPLPSLDLGRHMHLNIFKWFITDGNTMNYLTPIIIKTYSILDDVQFKILQPFFVDEYFSPL